MFWGLVLEPSKSYAQVVDTPFHVSMAALDLKNSDNQEEASTLILRQDNTEYVLANLSKKHKIFNITLGLDFDVGEEIEFFVQGQSQIHLTGFLAGDNDDDLDDFNEEDDENDIEEKLKDIKKAEAAKRKLKENSSGPVKKQKILDESFNDDSDEDDFDIDEDDLEDGEEEEDSDDSEIEDEDDSDEEMDEDIPSPPKKKQQQQVQQQKQTGAQSPESKKQKKKQKQQQQQQQQQQGKQVNQQQKNQANNKSPQKNQQPNKTPQKTPQGKNIQSKTPTNNKQQNAKSPQGNADAQQAKRPGKKVLKGGIVVEDITEGSGKVASSNKNVGVYYVGRLCSNKKEFDKTTGGKPFNFKLGRGEVIRGWDLGVEGMREGGKRKITIPAKFAYGNSGAPPLIPPNSALEFEVTLVNVK